MIAVDAANVYWGDHTGATRDEILKISINGGTAVSLAKGPESPGGLVVDASSVYWTTEYSGTIMKAPLAGGDATTLVSTGDNLYPIAVDDTNVYWLDSTSGSLNEVRHDGTAPLTLATGPSFPTGDVSTDGSNVYFAIGDPVSPGSGTIMAVPRGGGPVTTLASGQNNPVAIAVAGASVYWIDFDDKTLMKVPTGGGTVTTLATGQSMATLAADADNVYWTDDGSIKKVSVNGGSPTTLVSGQNHPGFIAVDETSVYYTVRSAIVKLTPK